LLILFSSSNKNEKPKDFKSKNTKTFCEDKRVVFPKNQFVSKKSSPPWVSKVTYEKYNRVETPVFPAAYDKKTKFKFADESDTTRNYDEVDTLSEKIGNAHKNG